jgi:hypothetical protein
MTATATVTATITISLDIENIYDRGTVYTRVTNEVIPAPPAPEEGQDEQDEWSYSHIFPFTGTSHIEGDSWYDVIVTACSDPTLVGRTFDFGY